jgi:hypothetical protein
MFTTHDSRLTIHDSRLTIHDSRFTIHDSRLTIHYSRFTIHGSRFTLHGLIVQAKVSFCRTSTISVAVLPNASVTRTCVVPLPVE